MVSIKPRNRRKKRSRKKRFKKQERSAKIAAMRRLRGGRPVKTKKRKFKVNWQKSHYININFLRSNFFMNLQEIHGISR